MCCKQTFSDDPTRKKLLLDPGGHVSVVCRDLSNYYCNFGLNIRAPEYRSVLPSRRTQTIVLLDNEFPCQ